jgi:hypothetical protein
MQDSLIKVCKQYGELFCDLYEAYEDAYGDRIAVHIDNLFDCLERVEERVDEIVKWQQKLTKIIDWLQKTRANPQYVRGEVIFINQMTWLGHWYLRFCALPCSWRALPCSRNYRGLLCGLSYDYAAHQSRNFRQQL